MHFIRSSLRAQLLLIGSTGLLGLAAAALVAILLVERVRVGGPVYEEVKLGQDLIADILPPPAYILESYLTCFQVLEADTPQRKDELLARGKELTSGFGGYQERLTYWSKALPAGQLRDALIGPSMLSAQQFISLRDGAFTTFVRAGKHAEARALLATEMKVAYDLHRTAIDNVVRLANERNAKVEDSVQDALHGGWIWFSCIICSAFTISISLILWSSRTITNSVHSTGLVVEQVAKGNLCGSAIEKRVDELGLLAKGVNRMVSDLRSLVSRLAASGKDVANQADTMGGLTTTVARGLAESSLRMQGMTAAVEQITVNFSEISNNIHEFTQALHEISHNVSNTTEHSTAVSGMIQQATTEVNGLGDAIDRIKGISTLIRKIAEQTNLLALNATIEAASAGEYGRGFAVVAGEVKILARKTADATAQIESLIQDVLIRSQGVGTSVSAVNGIIQQVVHAQGSVSSAVEEQTVTINEIGRVMKEAVNAMREISSNLVGLDGEMKRIGASSDLASGASRNLKDVAASMQDTVGKFSYL